VSARRLTTPSLGLGALLTALVALGPLSTDLYLPSLPTLAEVFATDAARVQLTLSVYLAGFAVAQLAYGALSDRFGRRPVMLGGLARRVLAFDRLLRAGLVLGVIVFAAVCAVTMLLTGGLLQFPAGTGGTWIMVIESAALVSIGLTLGLLYFGGRPHEHDA
jgi:MFS family permease